MNLLHHPGHQEDAQDGHRKGAIAEDEIEEAHG